jgi:UDPglucose--hexose-1-phosphate uridylyltransferase
MEENKPNTKINPEENPLIEKPTELRQDLVTDDWVVIATGRAKRPKEFAIGGREPFIEDPKQKCFFCYPEETGQERDVLIYKDERGDWTLRVFPNKYPAFLRGESVRHLEEGPYFKMDSVGYHEIVVPKNHSKQLAQMDMLEIAELIDAYQVRYIDLMNKRSVNYIEIFHNHGKEAGASIAHPHSQIMAIPVIAPYTKGELDGAENYFRDNQKCVYCTMIEWEIEHKERIVFENDDFVVFCPFASRAAFEMWVLPKKHKPYFERISNDEKMKAAEALGLAISKIFTKLNDPALNFYIHTSPCDGKDYPHYHWHIEIVPRISIWAGLELSTGIEISTIEPEKAAEFLREV